MRTQQSTSEGIPRIVPTDSCIRALGGTWELEGEMFVLERDTETGVLIACTVHGDRVNPIPIVTMGRKVQGWERH